MSKTRRQIQPGEEVLQLKITLHGSNPPIWRRILIPSKLTFFELHYAIQLAMGWSNAHLFEFVVRATKIGIADEETSDDLLDATATKVDSMLWQDSELERFIYLYDFGDDWYHDIIVEQRLLGESVQYYPSCIGGNRACPPEDCGGIEEYYRLLEILNNPDDPQHEFMKEWAPSDFDPEAFSVDHANEMLMAIEVAKKAWEDE